MAEVAGLVGAALVAPRRLAGHRTVAHADDRRGRRRRGRGRDREDEAGEQGDSTPHPADAPSRPTAAATSARDVTPSFAKTLVRWPSIVFSERKRSPAIWRLVRPRATSRAISRSRPLRAASPDSP